MEKLVGWLGAVQAQEYGPAKWGPGLRWPQGITERAIERAIDQGRITDPHSALHLALRRHRHIRWVLELTGPHVRRTMSSYDRQLGLETEVMTRATDVPLPVTITRRPVTSATRLRVILAPGGGQAIRIRPAR